MRGPRRGVQGARHPARGPTRPGRRSGSTATSGSRRTSRRTRRTSRPRSRGRKAAARMAARVRRGRNPGGYFHLAPGEVYIGGGMWHPPTAKLAAFRARSPTTEARPRRPRRPGVRGDVRRDLWRQADTRAAGLPEGPSRGRAAQAEGHDVRPPAGRRRRPVARPARTSSPTPSRSPSRSFRAGSARLSPDASQPRRNRSDAGSDGTIRTTLTAPDRGRPHPGRRPRKDLPDDPDRPPGRRPSPPRRQALHLRLGRRTGRGRRDDARPARRQGRGPGRDDQRGPARSRPASRSRPRPATTTSPRARSSPTACGRTSSRRSARSRR